METFASWQGLLDYLAAHSDIVHYQAPMDRHPVPVVVTRKFKNSKLRVAYHDVSFTADAGHLNRFRWKA
jgi:hypothetical protein